MSPAATITGSPPVGVVVVGVGVVGAGVVGVVVVGVVVVVVVGVVVVGVVVGGGEGAGLPPTAARTASRYVPRPEDDCHSVADSTLVPSPHSLKVVTSCHGSRDAT